MFTIKELKEVIKDLPDDMPFGLLDLTTDDSDDMNYSVEKDSFIVEDYYKDEDETEPAGKALFIVFENKLNPNAIDEVAEG